MTKIKTKRDLINYVLETRLTDNHLCWKAKPLTLLVRQLWGMSGIDNAKTEEPYFFINDHKEAHEKKCYSVMYWNTGITAGLVNMHYRNI